MTKPFDLSIYFVADPHECGARGVAHVVELAIKGGATFVQFRDKVSKPDKMKALAVEVLNVCRAKSIPFVINDNVALAKEIGADGVHIGQDDMSPAEARSILGDDAIIGLTAFNEAQLEAVNPRIVDYVGTGPVYETQTDKGKPVIGPESIGWLREFSSVPMVAIGGITSDNAYPVIKTGVEGVAMMRAIGVANNPDRVTATVAGLIRQVKAAA